MEGSEKIKIVGYVLIGIVAIIVLYKVVQMLKGAAVAVGDGLNLTTSAQETADDTARLAQLKIDSKKLSFNKDSYPNMAAQLFKAMKGAGTDHKMVVAVLGAMKNQNDWNATIKAFGIKEGNNLINWLRGEYKYSDTLAKAAIVGKLVNPLLGLASTVMGKKVTTVETLNSVLRKNGINQNLI